MSARLRLATTRDASQILDIYAPIVRDTFISFEQIVPDETEIMMRITSTLEQYPYLVCDIDGQIAGYCYASSFRSRSAYQWTTETTVYVHPNFHRRGIARALYSALLNILRDQGYLNAIGVIALPNDASVKFHEILGFEKIGVFHNIGYKQSGWRDTAWWQLELRSMPESPISPYPIDRVCTTDNFKQVLTKAEKYMRLDESRRT